MNSILRDGGSFREEVVNVKLAELLEDRDVVSLPEQVMADIVEENRLPDVMTANFLGIRIVIEGRTGQTNAVRTSLEEKCEERIAEGVAPLAVALTYPDGIGEAGSLDGLEENIKQSQFGINVLSESGSMGWNRGGLDDLADYLRRGYSDLVQEDVVEDAVDQVDNSIDDFVDSLSGSEGLSGTVERLEEVVIVPNE